MNRTKTLALWTEGREAWNAWAKERLNERQALEAAGRWDAEEGRVSDRGLVGRNDETRAWLNAARADFRGHSFDKDANFFGFTFPGVADFGPTDDDGRPQLTVFVKAADFREVRFSGEAWFDNAQFSDEARFDNAQFSGVATFGKAQFSGNAHFKDAQFSDIAWFNEARFSDMAWFWKAQFSGGVYFNEAQFSGEASFNGVQFSDDAWFTKAQFLDVAGFQQAIFDGPASFAKTRFIKAAAFTAIRSERGFTLEGARFAELPDFIQAHFAEAPRLDDMSIVALAGPWYRRLFHRDLDAAARYRALKRLAVQGHDHERELSFFAEELRSLRGAHDKLLPRPWNLFRKNKDGERSRVWPGGARYWFGLLYEILSDFGRSLFRPFAWWAVSVAGFAWAYLDRHFANPQAGLPVRRHGLALVLAHGLGGCVIPQPRRARGPTPHLPRRPGGAVNRGAVPRRQEGPARVRLGGPEQD